MKIDRFDRNGERLKLGQIIKNVYTQEEYEIVFSEDILAFGMEDKYGQFEFLSEWVPHDWEVIL